jgi:hypothetical protein
LYRSLDYRFCAKADNFFRIGNKPAAERASSERCVYHVFAVKRRTNLRRR